jgi:hypothetical protein
VKFTDYGRVDVDVSMIGHGAGSEWLRFVVADTGMGISEADRDSLFAPFSQVDASHTRRHGGTGLGLAISKELTERLGGEIWFESEPGGGSRFGFDVPFAPPAGDQEADFDRSPVAKLEAREFMGETRRVLIVEDNRINQAVLSAMVESFGFEVEVAEDGLQAIATTLREAPDLVLMDCQMPRLDGKLLL